LATDYKPGQEACIGYIFLSDFFLRRIVFLQKGMLKKQFKNACKKTDQPQT